MSRTGQTVRQDRLRSDSIWWTTLQTVTQKPKRTDSAVFGEPKRKSKINSADPYHPLHLFRWWSPTDSEGRDIIHLHQQHPGLQGVDRQTDKSAANGTKTAVSTHKYTQSHIHANQVIIKDEFVSTMCMLSCTDRQTHRHTHARANTITTPQSFYGFFQDHPGAPVPEENFWTLWCMGRLTEADTPTIWLGATPSGLTS